MSQAQRQKLRQAIKDWILFEVGVTEQLAELKEEMMTKFSEYRASVNQSLAAILNKAVEEKALLAKLIQATTDRDEAAINEAIAELSTSKQNVVDAIAGIVSSIPSPVTPTPVPAPTEGMPELAIPTIPLDSVPDSDPDVPLTIEPSPVGVGVDGGFNISDK